MAPEASARATTDEGTSRIRRSQDPLLLVRRHARVAHNERQTIDEIIRRVLAVPLKLELIVVDDCSTDGTRESLQQMQQELGFTLVLQPKNAGKGAALRAGFAHVRATSPSCRTPISSTRRRNIRSSSS